MISKRMTKVQMTSMIDHRICELKEQVAVLQAERAAADKALILAKEVASARWIAIIALLGVLANLAILFFKR